MKVKIKTWEEMVSENSITKYGDISIDSVQDQFTKQMETLINDYPDRIIEVESINMMGANIPERYSFFTTCDDFLYTIYNEMIKEKL